jgi:hypothetical protein
MERGKKQQVPKSEFSTPYLFFLHFLKLRFYYYGWILRFCNSSILGAFLEGVQTNGIRRSA